MRGQAFRLATATIAVIKGNQTIMIPAGTIITVVSDRDPGGLIYVLHEGRRIQMYEKDIQDRGTLVVTDRASGAGT